MSRAADLRSELRRVFVPRAQSLGFALDRRHAAGGLAFRREREGAAHLFEIRFDKYQRPRFVVDFGLCWKAGVIAYGRHIPFEEVRAADCAAGGRLQPGRGTGTRSWFRADSTLLQRVLPERLRPTPASAVQQLIALFEELEAYWETGAVGRHLRFLPNESVVDASPERSAGDAS